MTVFLYKTQFLQKISFLVSRGYRYWLSGSLDPEPAYKGRTMLTKFDELYAINATMQQRYRRRIKGLSNSKLLMWMNEKEKKIEWILLATEGIHDAVSQLKDSHNKKSRIEITGYELKRLPVSAHVPVWTWTMTRQEYEKWHDNIQNSIRKNDSSAMRQILYSLRRICGFKGLRKQVFRLQHFAIAEWKRSRRGDYPYEKIYVGWIGGFSKAETLTYTEAIKKLKQLK